MAIQQLQIPSSNINNTVDQSQWATLGNLGNVYREAQAQQRKQAALASLGTDPTANMQTLLTSGDPALAQVGLNLQQRGIEQQREDVRNKIIDARANADLAIRKAQEARAQGNYEEADKWQSQLPALLATIQGGTAAPAAAAPTAPFPAPLPSASPPTTLPPTAPPQAAPAVSAFGATPILPSGLQPGPAVPPVKAEGDEPSTLPGWVQSAQAQPPDTSIVGRVTSNLTSEHPTAAAGVNRDQIAALYANPLTRPLAQAFLQKQFNPGEWKYEKLEDGRLVAVNTLDPTKTMDVTPKTATGAPPASKEQRERDARFADATARGYDKDTANYYALNGKLPKEDLTPTEQKLAETHDATAKTGLDVLDNLDEMKKLSKTAYEGAGASTRASAAAALGKYAPQGALDTIRMQNLALQNVTQQAKTLFPGRILKSEIDLMQKIETLPDQPDEVRQQILTQLQDLIKKRVASSQETAKAIRDKTYFTKGFTPTYGRDTGGAVPPTGAAPSPTWKIVPGS
jgi:hypothetical protein